MGVDESSALHSPGLCWVKGHQGLKSSDNPGDSRLIGAAAVSALLALSRLASDPEMFRLTESEQFPRCWHAASSVLSHPALTEP